MIGTVYSRGYCFRTKRGDHTRYAGAPPVSWRGPDWPEDAYDIGGFRPVLA